MPEELQEIINGRGIPAEYYPFLPEAFEEFVSYHSVGETANKPRELLNNLERAAQRTITLEKQLIEQHQKAKLSYGRAKSDNLSSVFTKRFITFNNT